VQPRIEFVSVTASFRGKIEGAGLVPTRNLLRPDDSKQQRAGQALPLHLSWEAGKTEVTAQN
jgi:hypothetical protein